MSSSTRVHVSTTLDVTQAEYIHDLAKFGKDAMQELYSRWYVFGASVIDVVIRAGSLAFFTVIVTVLILSRRAGRAEKNTVGTMLFSTIALWWFIAATSAVAVLSKALQQYQRLASDMSPIADQLDTVMDCTVNASECTYSYQYYKPMYTYAMHQCVGTGALATKQVAMEAVICIFLWALLKNGKFIRGCILALFLVTCGSAATHAKNTCWPAPVPAESRIPPWNVVEEDLNIDPTTSNFFRATLVLALFLAIQRTWEDRHVVRTYLNALGPTHGSQPSNARRFIVMYTLPLGMLMFLVLIREALWNPRNLYEYAFLSWINGFCVPFLGICPCLMLFVYQFGRPVEGELSKEGILPGGGS